MKKKTCIFVHEQSVLLINAKQNRIQNLSSFQIVTYLKLEPCNLFIFNY